MKIDPPSAASSPPSTGASPFLPRRALLTALIGAGMWGIGLRALRPDRHARTPPVPGASVAPHTTPTPAEWIQQAQLAYERAEYHRAETCASQALRVFRQGGYMEGIGTALGTRGQALQALGEFRKSRECYEEGLSVWEHLHHKAGQAHMLEMLSGLAQHEGRDSEADRLLSRCEMLRQQLGDTVGVALCARNRGILAAEQGRYAAAEAEYARCLRLIRAQNKPEIVAHIQALRGAAARDQGHLTQARALLSSSLRFWRQRRQPRWLAGMLRHLGLNAFYAGRLVEAEKLLTESVRGYKQVGDAYATAETQIWLARALYHQGHARRAFTLLNRSAPVLQKQGARLAIVRGWEAAAEMLSATEPEAARSLLAQAASERTKLACPLPPIERKQQASSLQFLNTRGAERS